MQLLEDLKWRGLLYDQTEGLPEALQAGPLTGYIGFDPSARSLHVGNLLPMMQLARLQRHGHRPIALVGGGTGMIGDPSGKTQERQLLTAERVEENCQCIRAQLEPFLDFEAGDFSARLVNNSEWLVGMDLIAFLRDVGKHFTVNSMLAKESVKGRLEREEGISYTEFSYMLLQAYDFVVLNDRYGCDLQMGGSDQWGNITAGIDLLRRVRSKKAHGLVFPLVTTSAGVKFGKTEAGAVWLDPELTSPYRFYQFWINTDDRDAIRYLKSFTFLEKDEVAELGKALEEAPEQRTAQKRLASEMTALVHGPTALDKALKASHVLFGGEVEGLSADEIQDIFADVPSSGIPATQLAQGVGLMTVLAESGLTSSKGEAKRLIQGGGISVNNRKVNDFRTTLDPQQAIEGRFIVLRRGSKNYHLLKVVE
ncbi:MAG TPA: tyrosine--tRNA ligase [Acidobacteriota bacterium]|nr:tyrosine--tRNA ligase [Acidobacteriota bacterium]